LLVRAAKDFQELNVAVIDDVRIDVAAVLSNGGTHACTQNMMDDGWAPSRSSSIAMGQGTRQLDVKVEGARKRTQERWRVPTFFEQGNNAEVR